MQAAVPFTWEERPGKPKQRPRKLQWSSKVSDFQACASTGDYDLRNPEKMFSLQELFSKDSIRSSSTTNKEGFCLTPPPRFRYASGMSSTSSSSQSRSFSTPESPTCSPEADDDEADCSKRCKQEAGKRPWHARTRSVTLLDLIKTGNRDEIEPRDHRPQGEKTLAELFKSDTRKENKGLPVGHKPGSDSFMGSAARRRSSYLPYKQGLLSIFCLSPYKNGLVRCASPVRKYR